jgi:hypothetical protein
VLYPTDIKEVGGVREDDDGKDCCDNPEWKTSG